MLRSEVFLLAHASQGSGFKYLFHVCEKSSLHQKTKQPTKKKPQNNKNQNQTRTNKKGKKKIGKQKVLNTANHVVVLKLQKRNP